MSLPSVILALVFALLAVFSVPTLGDPLPSSDKDRDASMELSEPPPPPPPFRYPPQRPFPRNFFLRNNGWDKTPAMALFRRHMARGGGVNTRVFGQMATEVAVTKRTPEPESDAGFSLSIMSPLDVLREKMLLNVQKGRYQAKNRLASNNAEYLEKYG